MLLLRFIFFLRSTSYSYKIRNAIFGPRPSILITLPSPRAASSHGTRPPVDLGDTYQERSSKQIVAKSRLLIHGPGARLFTRGSGGISNMGGRAPRRRGRSTSAPRRRTIHLYADLAIFRIGRDFSK